FRFFFLLSRFFASLGRSFLSLPSWVCRSASPRPLSPLPLRLPFPLVSLSEECVAWSRRLYLLFVQVRHPEPYSMTYPLCRRAGERTPSTDRATVAVPGLRDGLDRSRSATGPRPIAAPRRQSLSSCVSSRLFDPAAGRALRPRADTPVASVPAATRPGPAPTAIAGCRVW